MYFIGIDLGGTGIKVGVVSRQGEILSEVKRPTDVMGGFQKVVKDMYELILEATHSLSISVDDITAVGIGSPGTVNGEKGIVTYSCNLHWAQVDLISELKKYIDKPIFVSNDANLAAFGEAKFGAGKESHSSVLITLGTGVGGGIIINDELFEGNEGAGAEIGHSVINCEGEPCSCGRRGCFEAYCSATALIRDTKRAMIADENSLMWNVEGGIRKVNGRTAFDYAKMGDESAKNVIKNYIGFLAEGIVNIANILRPEIIMIGGGISNEGDYLINPLQEYLNCYKYGGGHTPKVHVKKASLGNKAGIIGAAALAMFRVDNQDKPKKKEGLCV